MAKGKHSKPDGKYDERLMCNVQKLAYDFCTQTGRLDFPEGDCCDMSGAIALFTAIDPGVRQIETFAGGKPDTVYQRDGKGGEWAVLLPRQGRSSKQFHRGCVLRPRMQEVTDHMLRHTQQAPHEAQQPVTQRQPVGRQSGFVDGPLQVVV